MLDRKLRIALIPKVRELGAGMYVLKNMPLVFDGENIEQKQHSFDRRISPRKICRAI